MTESRDVQLHFHDELDELERSVLSVVDRAEQTVEMAVNAVINDDMELAQRVIDLGRNMDEVYLEIHSEWTRLMARNQPLGSDLRKMTIFLHLNFTFRRMTAQCVNIAKAAVSVEGQPQVEAIIKLIREMGDLVRPMIRTAIEAYLRLDLTEASLLPLMDDPVDRLNEAMYREAVTAASIPENLEWATKMLLVGRALERIGDQSVDFAEQTSYLITGHHSGLGKGAQHVGEDDSG